MRRTRRHRVLHAALLMLVAFGVLLQPVLGALGELHGLSHAMALDRGHGAADAHGAVHDHDLAHSHDHAHAHASDHAHGAPVDGHGDAGEPLGAHGLMHQGCLSVSMALLPPGLPGLAPAPVAMPPDQLLAAGPPPTPFTSPFRPPIA